MDSDESLEEAVRHGKGKNRPQVQVVGLPDVGLPDVGLPDMGLPDAGLLARWGSAIMRGNPPARFG